MSALVLFIALAYLAGSVPFGVVLARARGVDLRAIGSGNIGATNAARALGKKLGGVVFLCDAAKGLLPVLLARRYAPSLGATLPLPPDWLVAMVGAAAFLGHLYPIWLRLRGGKGVATAFGVFLALSPWAALAAIALFAVLYARWRVSSIGSLGGATLFVPTLYLLGAPAAYLALAGFTWALIVWRHRGNIGRLLRHEESRV